MKKASDRLVKDLKRLKVELGCKTWAELLEKLVRLEPKHAMAISVEEDKQIKRGVDGFLELQGVVSKMWVGSPSVTEEFRKMRSHE